MLTRKTLVITLIIALAYSQTFEEFEVRFNRRYATEAERQERKQIFLQNKAKIDQHNANSNEYKAGVNQFTDKTQEEAQRFAGLKKLRVPQNTHTDTPRSRVGASVGLPVSVDWRNELKVSAIKNQGSCGSCWVFTTVGLLQSFLMIGGMAEPDLSQQFVLQCTTANSPQQTVSDCGGGILDYAIPFVVSNGVPLQTAFPYTAGNYGSVPGYPTTAGICTTTDLVKDTTLNGTYKAYTNLTHDEMKDLIAFAPIAVAMFANPAFMSYTSGVFTGCPDFATSVASVNHAIIVVGYDASGNYIIKNSWGTNWGQNGYATISKDFDCACSYLPRQIRGTNTQLSGFYLFASSILILVFMLF